MSPSMVNPPTSAQTITLASGALLSVNADGGLRYDPNGKFDGLTDFERAIDSFTYTIATSMAPRAPQPPRSDPGQERSAYGERGSLLLPIRTAPFGFPFSTTTRTRTPVAISGC